jgi:hypothetical protein
MSTRYRIFTNDVGPSQFSCLECCVAASSDSAALVKAMDMVKKFAPCKVLAIPENKVQLWPDGKTGSITSQTWINYGVEVAA